MSSFETNRIGAVVMSQLKTWACAFCPMGAVPQPGPRNKGTAMLPIRQNQVPFIGFFNPRHEARRTKWLQDPFFNIIKKPRHSTTFTVHVLLPVVCCIDFSTNTGVLKQGGTEPKGALECSMGSFSTKIHACINPLISFTNFTLGTIELVIAYRYRTVSVWSQSLLTEFGCFWRGHVSACSFLHACRQKRMEAKTLEVPPQCFLKANGVLLSF